MRSYFVALSFILLFSLSEASAQNLMHLVDQPFDKSTTTTDKVVNLEQTLVKIDVVGLQGNFFKLQNPPPAPKSIIEKATDIVNEAYFQRQRFKETGQPI